MAAQGLHTVSAARSWAVPRRAATYLAFAFAVGCGHAPPASLMPDAATAIARARESAACGTGVQASAKLDDLGSLVHLRGDLLLFASAPDRLRMDIVSPFGAALFTLTSDGRNFKLADLREKRFFTGKAAACNIARLTRVPLPPHVLVSLLRGQAPLLRHDATSMRLRWSSKGYYVVVIPSTRSAEEELQLEPHPDDLQKPWQAQRLRLVGAGVRQYGRIAWRASLGHYDPAPMASPRIDPDGVDPPVAPSGPVCSADLPRQIRVEVPDDGQDVVVRYDQVTWNPPLPEGTFDQPVPPGMRVERVDCPE